MTPLATTFTFRGSTFRQLKRSGKVALYSRGVDDAIDGFEVIRIKDLPEATWPNGKVTEAHEGYPSDNDFGTRGWYYMVGDVDRAEARYRRESRQAESRRDET